MSVPFTEKDIFNLPFLLSLLEVVGKKTLSSCDFLIYANIMFHFIMVSHPLNIIWNAEEEYLCSIVLQIQMSHGGSDSFKC